MPSRFLLIVAIVFGAAGISIWALFLRPVSIQTAAGRIARKTHKPAGTYWQYPSGLDRGFRVATPIPIAEADIFELAIDGFDGPLFYSMNTVASKAFAVGQRIRIEYSSRAMPFFAPRVYVLNLSSSN